MQLEERAKSREFNTLEKKTILYSLNSHCDVKEMMMIMLVIVIYSASVYLSVYE